MKFSNKEILIFIAIAALFLVLRLPGIHLPYHQDEYKWPIIVNPALTEPGGIPHPPVGEFIYKIAGQVAGFNNFRVVPLVFSFANLFLLFYLVKNIFSQKAALWSVFLFAISFYSVLASLMVDVDGAVMPFFFLLMMIGYFRLKRTNFQFSPKQGKPATGQAIFNFAILIAGAIGGFLVKVSGILPIFAVFLDFLIEKRVFSDKKKILKYLGFSALGLIGLVIILLLAKIVFPFFPLEKSFKYWSHFAVFVDRGWLQTFIQFVKSILYSSPLLILPVFFVDREIWRKTRPFFLFIFVGLVFYLFAFDFSIGALDRYFQFLIIPLCIITGAVFAKFMNYESRIMNYAWPLILSILIFLTQFLNHFVPPLYPKIEWISRILSFKWDFLYPFSGGSGPLPFYISFTFIALVWIYCLAYTLPALTKKSLRKNALVAVLILGLMYNAVFAEEYLFGKINGSAPKLFEETKAFIAENENIRKVVVYNDIGGYEIQQINKYKRRLYAAPQFEETYKDFFKNFSGHILYIDIPRIGDNNFYSNYLNSCKNIYEKNDKYITAKILDCQK